MTDTVKFTLPKAPLVYPALSRPDTKFDPLGQYKSDVRVSAEEAAPYIAKIQERAKAHLGKVLPKSGNSVWKPVLDDNGEETGEVVFQIRVKNKNRKDGKLWDRRPLVIDAKKNVVGSDVNPWGGTIARVQAEIYEWEFGGKKGISLQPVIVQIIELKSGQGNAPDVSDFDEEDGFATVDADTSDFADEDGDVNATSDNGADY